MTRARAEARLLQENKVRESVSNMNQLTRRGLPTYSELGFGESLSKIARHELAILCLEGIRLELNRKPLPNKSRGRGRPTSAIGVLAQRMSVHNDSVRRWANIQEVQASDFNATRLAEMAFKYSPEKVAKILMEDLSRHRMALNQWLKEADSKYRASPYVKNNHSRPYIALHKRRQAEEGS